MKAFTLLCLLMYPLSCLLAAQADDPLRVEPAEVSKTIVVDNIGEDLEAVTAIVLTNNSGRTLQLLRKTVSLSKPDNWRYETLDRVNDLTPFVETAGEQARSRASDLRLAPGQSATVYLILRPDGVVGEGVAELRFSDLTVPGRTIGSARVAIKLSRLPIPDSAAAQDPPGSVRLYPNPATDRFFVEAPPNVRLGRVEVTNTLGRRIKVFERVAGEEGYEITTLPDGLYLISIYDDRGKKLKTLRLLHRRFGA